MTTTSQAGTPPGTGEPGASTSYPVGGGTHEIELLIEGMTCAACAVRVEKKLNKLDGVRATVNYATATARVTAPAVLPVPTLTAAVEQAGCAARVPASARQAGEDEDDGQAAGRDAAYLRRRLIVALVFFVPLTDVSLVLSLMPSDRFPAGSGCWSAARRRWRCGARGRSTGSR